VIRRDNKKNIKFIPNDFESVNNIDIELEIEFPINTIVCIDKSEIYKGSRAIFLTVSKTGGIIGLISLFFSISIISFLLQPGYLIFAKYRGKFARFFDG
tara:strand:- start:249 stop:545 length:297 start_codon:yes stop_codon:yes gene_type:complete